VIGQRTGSTMLIRQDPRSFRFFLSFLAIIANNETRCFRRR